MKYTDLDLKLKRKLLKMSFFELFKVDFSRIIE